MLIPPLQSRIDKDDIDATPNLIIEAFAAKAKKVGIRSIVMSELASDMRVSKKTLYKYFKNKDELVHELIVRWENRLFKTTPVDDGDIVALLRRWVMAWLENDAQYSTDFWRELRGEYPELYQHYTASLFERINAMKKLLIPYLDEDMDNEFTWLTYRALISNAAKPKMFEKLGLSREECVNRTLDFWVKGALSVEKLNKQKNIL